MADRERTGDKVRSSPSKSKLVRSQKIITLSPTDGRPQDIPEDSEPKQVVLPTRSHTPGQLASKSSSARKHSHSHSSSKDRDKEGRSRSHSVSSTTSKLSTPSTPVPKLPTNINGLVRPTSRGSAERIHVPLPSSASSTKDERPSVMRSTSAIVAKSPVPRPQNLTTTSSPAPAPKASSRGPSTTQPPLIDPESGPDVPPAPASAMYWSQALTSGAARTSLRAHTTTLVGSNIYIFGGCDSRSCFNELYVLDADCFYWSTPLVHGECPLPLRAMTCTAVGKKLVVFGGGDGPAYYNDVYVLDTINFRWSKPKVAGTPPSKRRAHTACFYRNGIYVFGGGDGVRALNDVWRLDVADVTKMSWKLISPPTTEKEGSHMVENKPKARGYHTANMVDSKLIIFGGSDGGECFRDVWVFDVESLKWKAAVIPISYPRLSHTATIVGSYLFVIGGHDGVEYSNEVLLLNLVTMQWDKRKIYGVAPSGRGYHGAVLHDSRLIVTGGFDGSTVFGDVAILELAVHAYYSQISHFSIEV